MSDFSDTGTSFIHESFHKDNASYFTREWFAGGHSTGTKEHQNVALADLLARQRSIIGSNRAASGPYTVDAKFPDAGP